MSRRLEAARQDVTQPPPAPGPHPQPRARPPWVGLVGLAISWALAAAMVAPFAPSTWVEAAVPTLLGFFLWMALHVFGTRMWPDLSSLPQPLRGLVWLAGLILICAAATRLFTTALVGPLFPHYGWYIFTSFAVLLCLELQLEMWPLRGRARLHPLAAGLVVAAVTLLGGWLLHRALYQYPGNFPARWNPGGLFLHTEALSYFLYLMMFQAHLGLCWQNQPWHRLAQPWRGLSATATAAALALAANWLSYRAIWNGDDRAFTWVALVTATGLSGPFLAAGLFRDWPGRRILRPGIRGLASSLFAMLLAAGSWLVMAGVGLLVHPAWRIDPWEGPNIVVWAATSLMEAVSLAAFVWTYCLGSWPFARFQD